MKIFTFKILKLDWDFKINIAIIFEVKDMPKIYKVVISKPEWNVYRKNDWNIAREKSD